MIQFVCRLTWTSSWYELVRKYCKFLCCTDAARLNSEASRNSLTTTGRKIVISWNVRAHTRHGLAVCPLFTDANACASTLSAMTKFNTGYQHCGPSCSCACTKARIPPWCWMSSIALSTLWQNIISETSPITRICGNFSWVWPQSRQLVVLANLQKLLAMVCNELTSRSMHEAVAVSQHLVLSMCERLCSVRINVAQSQVNVSQQCARESLGRNSKMTVRLAQVEHFRTNQPMCRLDRE